MTAPLEFDIHPDMQELIASKQAVSQTLDPAEMRSDWNAYGARLQRDRPAGMAVRDIAVRCAGAGRDDTIPLRFYRPENATESGACVVYLHGGAFVKGSLDSGDSVAWGIADQVGAIVVTVDYRLAPENPFPAGVEDCYATVRHLAENSAEYGLNPARIALWGDSAGGNMAAATCLMARDRGGPDIAAQALSYPCLTDELTSHSYVRYNESPGLRTGYIDTCWSLYLGDRRPTGDAYAAPLKAGDLTGLPPAHIHFAEIDPLADDSRQYAERLAAAGASVVLRCAERMIHGFNRARFSGPGAAAEFAAPCAFLKRSLDHSTGG